MSRRSVAAHPDQLDFFETLYHAPAVRVLEPPPPKRPEPVRIIPEVIRSNAVVPENYRITASDILYPAGAIGKINANLRAVELAKRLAAANIPAAPEEKAILIQYSGWGGIPQAFDDRNEKFATHYLKLKELLTEEEYASARASTLTSFYTPRELIEAMWQLAQKLEFAGGKVGEFGAGIGHFIGLCPADIAAKTRFTAIEADRVSAMILKLLYPKAAVHHRFLEKTYLTDEKFDLIIGNVPFGSNLVFDPNYPDFNLHNYFIARSLDLLHDGGLYIALTSSHTLDSRSSQARRYFGDRAGLLGAFRFPDNTFRSCANTEVVSDLLVFHSKASDECKCYFLGDLN